MAGLKSLICRGQQLSVEDFLERVVKDKFASQDWRTTFHYQRNQKPPVFLNAILLRDGKSEANEEQGRAMYKVETSTSRRPTHSYLYGRVALKLDSQTGVYQMVQDPQSKEDDIILMRHPAGESEYCFGKSVYDAVAVSDEFFETSRWRSC